jgi:hypothetical protein
MQTVRNNKKNRAHTTKPALQRVLLYFIYVCALRKQQDDELGADDAQEHG